MKRYTCSGYKSVQAEDIRSAARTFAQRAARREFGRTGDVRTCEMQSYSQDVRLAEFSAFIGLTHGNETTGHNIVFTVHTVGH